MCGAEFLIRVSCLIAWKILWKEVAGVYKGYSLYICMTSTAKVAKRDDESHDASHSADYAAAHESAGYSPALAPPLND